MGHTVRKIAMEVVVEEEGKASWGVLVLRTGHLSNSVMKEALHSGSSLKAHHARGGQVGRRAGSRPARIVL